MMRKLLKFLVVFAIISNALCLDLGRLLGLRRNWRDHSVHTADPEIVEVVRWRQPVCVVAGPGVPPCFLALKKYQNEYEKNSAKGLEEKQSDRKNVETEEKETETKKKRETSFLHGINDEDHSDKVSRSNSETLTNILTPHVADYIHLENFESAKLEGSEGSSLDHHTMKVRSVTPGIENGHAHRQGRYLIISTVSRAQTAVRTPPAISVTKVLNSPVTATLVANNCFPDIGVPLCDDYQETITIYKDPIVTTTAHESSSQKFISYPENDERVTETTENQQETESADFPNEPGNLNFDDGTKGPQTRKGLLGQVVQHVINKPGVMSAIPPVVIDAIVNHPGILEAIGNIGQPEIPEASDAEIASTVQTYNFQSSTSKPGLMETLLDKKPAILGNFGFNIFNKGTTTKPTVVHHDRAPEDSDVPIGEYSGPDSDVETIEGIKNNPEVIGIEEGAETAPVIVTEETKKPGFFENLWTPGSFGIFNKTPPIVTKGKSENVKIKEQVLDKEETKSTHSTLVEKPETLTISEIFFKQENDISERPSLPDIFNKVTDNGDEHEAKPTQAPGIFGGLFSNPVRPSTIDESVEKTKTLLGIGNSNFAKTPRKSLVIERPGDKLLLVEKPIYLAEKPSHASELLNFFEASEYDPLLNVDHEIIKEPVYVYQKPQTSFGIRNNGLYNGTGSRSGFFQGWAIFGNSEEKPSENKGDQAKNETEKYTQSNTSHKGISESPGTTIPDEEEKSIVTESAKTEKFEVSVVDINEQQSYQQENTELIDETADKIAAEPRDVSKVPGSVANVIKQNFDQAENINLTGESLKKNSTEPTEAGEISVSTVDVQEEKFDEKENIELTKQTVQQILTENTKSEDFKSVLDVSEQNFHQEDITESTEETIEEIKEIPTGASGIVEAEKVSKIDEQNSQNVQEKITISTDLEKNPEIISTKSPATIDDSESPKELVDLPEIEEKIKEIEDTDEFDNVLREKIN